MTADINSRLGDIRERLVSGEASPTPTVREFISWVGAQRRGWYVVYDLRQALESAGLTTNPDFNVLHIDAPIAFVLRESVKPMEAGSQRADDLDGQLVAEEVSPGLAVHPVDTDDPRHRVSRLASANHAPTSIVPTTPLLAAVTTMLTCDFSQLPVMTGERHVKGVVSWQSIAKCLTTGKQGDEAQHFMVPARIVAHDESLLTAMSEVSTHGYVLVRDAEQRICGIVTTTDINEQFMQLTEPFLLLGEIEQALRGLLDRLPKAMLQGALDPGDETRIVDRAADLSFGEYVRLLQDSAVWVEVKVPLDRQVFVAFLDQVRATRNDVMHFDPDGIPDESLNELRNLVKLLDWLRL